MALGGVCLGLAFDTTRVLRGVLRPGRLAAAAGDFLFWLVATFIIAAAFLVSNYGQIRLGALVGLGLGALAYWRLCSSICVVALSSLFRLLGRVAAACIGACQMPISAARGWAVLASHRIRSARGAVRGGRPR